MLEATKKFGVHAKSTKHDQIDPSRKSSDVVSKVSADQPFKLGLSSVRPPQTLFREVALELLDLP